MDKVHKMWENWTSHKNNDVENNYNTPDAYYIVGPDMHVMILSDYASLFLLH